MLIKTYKMPKRDINFNAFLMGLCYVVMLVGQHNERIRNYIAFSNYFLCTVKRSKIFFGQ